MKTLILCSVLVGSAIAAHAEEGFHTVVAGADYDTPRIPGSEWRVHQQDRPQPPRVKPGKPLDGSSKIPILVSSRQELTVSI